MPEIKRFNNQAFTADLFTWRTGNKYSRNKMSKETGVGTGYHYAQIEYLEVQRPNIEVVFNACNLMGKDINEYFV